MKYSGIANRITIEFSGRQIFVDEVVYGVSNVYFQVCSEGGTFSTEFKSLGSAIKFAEKQIKLMVKNNPL